MRKEILLLVMSVCIPQWVISVPLEKTDNPKPINPKPLNPKPMNPFQNFTALIPEIYNIIKEREFKDEKENQTNQTTRRRRDAGLERDYSLIDEFILPSFDTEKMNDHFSWDDQNDKLSYDYPQGFIGKRSLKLKVVNNTLTKTLKKDTLTPLNKKIKEEFGKEELKIKENLIKELDNNKENLTQDNKGKSTTGTEDKDKNSNGAAEASLIDSLKPTKKVSTNEETVKEDAVNEKRVNTQTATKATEKNKILVEEIEIIKNENTENTTKVTESKKIFESVEIIKDNNDTQVTRKVSTSTLVQDIDKTMKPEGILKESSKTTNNKTLLDVHSKSDETEETNERKTSIEKIQNEQSYNEEENIIEKSNAKNENNDDYYDDVDGYARRKRDIKENKENNNLLYLTNFRLKREIRKEDECAKDQLEQKVKDGEWAAEFQRLANLK